MGASVDGFISDRAGRFDWTAPSDEVFAFHLEQVGALGAYLLGRRLYEDMRVWETDPSMRDTEPRAAFADIWLALPKIVFSRTLDRVEGENTRLAETSLPEEVAAVLASTDKDVSIGGATLAGEALRLGLVDELHLMRHPILVGGGTPFFPPLEGDLPLHMVETREFNSRLIYERYRRAL